MGEQCLLAQLPPAPKDQRATLPRGCRFQDLSEAHRNITGRSISNGFSDSLASNPSSHNTVSPRAENVESSGDESLGRNVIQIVPRSEGRHGNSRSANDHVDNDSHGDEHKNSPSKTIRPLTASSRSKKKYGCSDEELKTPEKSFPPISILEDGLELDPEFGLEPESSPSSATSSTSPSSTNDATFERLYKQYQAQLAADIDADLDSPPATTPDTGRTREGAKGRAGFRQHSHAKPPSYSGNAISPRSDEALQDTDAGTAFDCTSQHDEAQDQNARIATRESLLYPMPLRVQSIKAEGKHMSCRSGPAVSATGMTTDSDDDPFRYDKDSYKIFLHPSKERDVSAALNHISGLSSHSQATIYSQDGDVIAHQSSHQPPPIPREYVEEKAAALDRRSRSPTPESLDGFYDTSVIQPNWTPERGTYEVKVVLQDAKESRDPMPQRHLNNPNRGIERSNLGGDKPAFNSRNFSKASSCRVTGKEHVASSERDEWETVATSAPGFGSVGRSYLRGATVNSRGIKITGSSIANVSDGSSCFHVPFDEYASTDRIAHHSSGQEASEESLQIRHMSGTRFPVILPKQRLHRVNGLTHDPVSVISASHRSGSEAAAAFVKKMSSPFRQLGGRRTYRFSPMPLQPLSSNVGKGHLFEPRRSQESDCKALCGQEFHAAKGERSETTDLQIQAKDSTTSGITTGDGNYDEDSSQRASGSSQSSGATVHSFPFPLIPLPEAARLQAVQRTEELNTLNRLQCRDKQPTRHGNRPSQADHGSQGARPGATNNKVGIPSPAHYKTPSGRFSSFFVTSPTRHSQLRKQKSVLPHVATLSSTDSAAAGGTWATITPFGSSSTRNVTPSHILKAAATKLQLNELGQRLKQSRGPKFSIGSGSTSGSPTPRLYPWDYYQQQRRPQRPQRPRYPQRWRQETDPELRAIAVSETESYMARNTMHDLESTGVPLDPEAFVSRQARRRRQTWFLCMLAVSVFPFISVLVYLGKFDSGLSWYTRGEVDRLNVRQRRTILAIMVLQFVLWPCVIVLVAWRAQ